MKQPTVSTIIPVYNGERYLAAALDSVLNQSAPPTEIVVVDDGSSDGSAAIAHRYAPFVHCYQQPHAGPGAARNQGASMAQGDYLAFLDADDLWLPDKLASQMAYLQTHPEIDMVFGHVEQFISPDLTPDQYPALPEQPIIAGLGAGTMLIHRSHFHQVGPFPTQWMIGEFIEWYSRAQTMGLQATVLPQVVMRRRLHTTNLTRRTQDRRSDYLQILKLRLDEKRRRQTGAPTDA